MTDEARRAIEAAKTEEEEKAVAEKFKLTMRLLSDEELDEVAGGGNLSCMPSCSKKDNKCWCPDRKPFELPNLLPITNLFE